MKGFSDFLKEKEAGAKKSLSQNFLIQPKVCEKLVAAAELHPGDKVLEIGPGGGALTFPLLERGVDLTAIEISPLMIEWLTVSLGDKLRLIFEDALKVDFKALYPDQKRITLFSSVPYNITSPLFEHLFSSNSLFKQYLVILQKEVGDVLLATPGSKSYGILSILAQRFTVPSKLFVIPKGNFSPVPKVDSMALLLNAKEGIEDDAVSFVQFLKQIFSLRRKTLEHAFKILGFSPILEKRRAEMLIADEIYRLFKNK